MHYVIRRVNRKGKEIDTRIVSTLCMHINANFFYQRARRSGLWNSGIKNGSRTKSSAIRNNLKTP